MSHPVRSSEIRDAPSRRGLSVVAPAPARRIRTLASLDEAALEEKRQALLWMEWRRQRNKILTALAILGVATGKIPLQDLVDVLRAALGVP